MEYTIAILGPKNSGKTTYIKSITNLGYDINLDKNITTCIFAMTSVGDIKINFIEINNQTELNYDKIDGLIVIFDLPNIAKIEDYLSVIDINKKIPKVLIGNKHDLGKLQIIDDIRLVFYGDIEEQKILNVFNEEYRDMFDAFYDRMSALIGYCIENPLTFIISKLTNEYHNYVDIL